LPVIRPWQGYSKINPIRLSRIKAGEPVGELFYRPGGKELTTSGEPEAKKSPRRPRVGLSGCQKPEQFNGNFFKNTCLEFRFDVYRIK